MSFPQSRGRDLDMEDIGDIQRIYRQAVHLSDWLRYGLVLVQPLATGECVGRWGGRLRLVSKGCVLPAGP
jgi:hypothetical protein